MPGTIKNSISQNEYMIIKGFFSNYPKIKDKNLDDCIAAFPAFMGSEHTTALPMFTENLQTRNQL